MKYYDGKGFLPENYKNLGVFDEDKPCDILEPEIFQDEYVTYYFDSENGCDENDGLTENSAKKSIAEIQKIISCGSDKGIKIALKGGCRFDGDLIIDGKTDKNHPFIICSYGKKQAIIYGTNEVLRIYCSNVVVDGVEVTGPEALRGIFVQPQRAGVLENVVIKNCYVHDVNFMWYLETSPAQTCPDKIDLERVCPEYYPNTKTYYRYNRRSHGGIIFLNDTEESVGASWFENVFIIGNRVENVARTGIYVANVWGDKAGIGYGYNKYVKDSEDVVNPEKGLGYFRSKNVVCSSNSIVCAGGDGVILSAVFNAFIEFNVCYYANYLGRTNYWNAGIWVFDTEQAWFRYNEAAYTYMRNNSNDAQGFDLDNACVRVVFKGNYSHHNEGGGLLVCNRRTKVKLHDKDGNVLGETDEILGKWYDNLVCCNLFVENGNTWDPTRSAFITIARETDFLFAYSNFVVLRSDIVGQSLINTEDQSQYSYNNYYFDNVFYCAEKVDAKYTVNMLKDSVFKGNVYKNVGDFSDVEEPNDILPVFFTKECLYGLLTKSRTVSQNDYLIKLKSYLEKIV